MKEQLAITQEELANGSVADERRKWDGLLFMNTTRGEVGVRASACTCVPERASK